jgi:hypothetical protein
MPKIAEMLPSSYLKQTDFTEEGFIVTISHIKHENLANEKDAPDFKYVVYFKEFEKGLVLNVTNINGLAKACNSDDTDDWAEKEVIVFVDPNVGYGGQTTGGLRIKRLQSTQPKAAQTTSSR